MSFNFKLSNFVSEYVVGDVNIKINTKDGTHIYSVNPDISYFYYKNNYIVIKVEDQENILLDFETKDIAIQALQKLNDVKKSLHTNPSTPGEGGATTLIELTDTEITQAELTDQSYLKWDNSSGRWKNHILDVTSSTYSNTEQIPETIGGIDAGSTFDMKTMKEMWDSLLYPYQYPNFTLLSISEISGTYEYGTILDFNSLSFNWTTTNNDNITANSISITGEEINNLSNLANNGSVSVLLNNPITNINPSKTNSTWYIQGTNSNNDTFGRSVSINWKYYIFYGNDNNTLPNDSANVRALSKIWNSNSFSYDVVQGQYNTAFYIQGDEKTISVKHEQSSWREIQGEFTRTQITIKDGDNNDTLYTKYEQNIGSGYASNATYHIIIS